MEPISFSTARKTTSRDHAAWAAKMFDDIQAKERRAETIAIIHATQEDLADDMVQYALTMLGDKVRQVNWADPNERQQFIEERVEVAHTPHRPHDVD
jgi:hypothetical protein